MKPKILALLLLAFAQPLVARSFGSLPDWAEAAIQKAEASKPPPDADRWVILDRTEFAYTGDGEVRTHRFRVVKVLSDRGRDAATFVLMGLGGGASKVKKLKGWNLRPNGEMEKLESDHVIAIENAGNSNGVDNSRLTGATLGRVVKGSYVAFESLQSFQNPTGPAGMAFPLEQDPVFRWEFAAAKHEGWFTNLSGVGVAMDVRHFKPWISAYKEVPGEEIDADNLPALPKDEKAEPWPWNAVPRVQVRFLDPALHDSLDLKTWDGIASWIEKSYLAHADASAIPGLAAHHDVEGLKAISSWMSRELIYKQVYLSPERGFVPLDAADVVRRRYGDCKDLASCFIAAAKAAGFKAYPVLARIVEGRIEPDEPISVAAFNHMIAAVRLDHPLGLPAEVETPAGRFLLVDPTARLTPFGVLPQEHRGGRVMLCAGQAGTWITIPDAAIEPSMLKVTLEARVDGSGRLEGTARLDESGDAEGLRSAALSMTPKDLKAYVLDHLIAIPSDGILEIQGHGDPLDLSKPFHMDVRLVHPRGVTFTTDEADLDALGIFRLQPGVIQPGGQARRYPVEQRASARLEVEAELHFPGAVAPFLPEKSLTGPFRNLSWSAKAVAAGTGTTVSLNLDSRLKPVYFGFGEQEQGVAAWSKYRKESRAFLDDALAFKRSH